MVKVPMHLRAVMLMGQKSPEMLVPTARFELATFGLQNRHRRSDNAGLSRFWPIGWVILSSLSGLKWVQRFKAHPSAVVAVVITIRAGKLCHQLPALPNESEFV